MPEPDIGLAILRGMRWVGAAVFLLALLLAWLLPTRRIHRMAALAGVLVLPLFGLGWEEWREHLFRSAQAQARSLFEAHCRSAGVQIHRAVDGVEGVLLMRRRAPATAVYKQYAMTDPYGDDLNGDGYALSFLWGRNGSGRVESTATSAMGYRYVVMANEDGVGYTRFELGGGTRDEGGVLPVLRSPATELPRYGITWEDLSSREDRDHWIAGSRLMAVDTATGEVIAERIGWMWDASLDTEPDARHAWTFAAAHACPAFPLLGGQPYRIGQTRTFAEQVLRPDH